ncbi:MAG: hypothetical protein HGA45_07820 [Chloroflexales bacterium]|nr:hypothetical protein [Chloroflexales bacterium]
MSAELLLEVHTATRRYLVPQAHLDHLAQMVTSHAPAPARRSTALVCRELGPLLDPADAGGPGRRHALTVELRRRTVALLVERAESLATHGVVQPIGALLARRLAQPWVLGAVLVGDDPVLVLDLRRIAADVALGAV